MNGKTVQVCQVCGANEDLRYGACFTCSDTVRIDGNGLCHDERTGIRWLARADWEDRAKSIVYIVQELGG